MGCSLLCSSTVSFLLNRELLKTFHYSVRDFRLNSHVSRWVTISESRPEPLLKSSKADFSKSQGGRF